MTQQERAEYRAKMCAAKTYEEQDQIRQRHYNAMRIRARARGVFLPEEPLVREVVGVPADQARLTVRSFRAETFNRRMSEACRIK